MLCHYAEYCLLFITMLNVSILSVSMVGVIMLNVSMLSVVLHLPVFISTWLCACTVKLFGVLFNWCHDSKHNNT